MLTFSQHWRNPVFFGTLVAAHLSLHFSATSISLCERNLLSALSSLLNKFTCSLLAGSILLAVSATAQAEKTRCLSECKPRIGIVSAFGAEADLLLEQTQRKRDWRINGNRFTTGILRGNPVVIVLSGVGIVNASMVTQLMLDHFRIERLLMSGIAGGVSPDNHVGDVVVPERWALPLEVYWHGDASVPAPCGTSAGDLSCLGLQLAQEDDKPRPDFKLDTPQGPVST